MAAHSKLRKFSYFFVINYELPRRASGKRLRASAGAAKVALNGRRLTAGSVMKTGASYLVPCQDAPATNTLSDRGEISFEGVEKVDW